MRYYKQVKNLLEQRRNETALFVLFRNLKWDKYWHEMQIPGTDLRGDT